MNDHRIKEYRYVTYNPGLSEVPVHIDAVHAQGPNADLYTGEQALKIAASTGASYIIGNVSRNVMDLNRPRNLNNYPAIDEYREAFTDILETKGLLDEYNKLKQPFLHLSIHGMQDSWSRDVEIGTGYGHYCSPDVKDWMVKHTEAVTANYGVDDIFPGYTFRSVLREGDVYGATGFMGFGRKMNSVQIEISKSWRANYQDTLVRFFNALIEDFKHKFDYAGNYYKAQLQ